MTLLIKISLILVMFIGIYIVGNVFHWIPTGYQRSYVLTIRVKADILKDVKLERKRDWIAPEFN